MTLSSHKSSLNVDTVDKLFPTGPWKGLAQERLTADTSNSHLGQHHSGCTHTQRGGWRGGAFSHLRGAGHDFNLLDERQTTVLGKRVKNGNSQTDVKSATNKSLAERRDEERKNLSGRSAALMAPVCLVGVSPLDPKYPLWPASICWEKEVQMIKRVLVFAIPAGNYEDLGPNLTESVTRQSGVGKF